MKAKLALGIVTILSLIIFTIPVSADATNTTNSQVTGYSSEANVLVGQVFETIKQNTAVAQDLRKKGLYVPEGANNEAVPSPEEIRNNLERIGLTNVPIPTRKSNSPGEINVREINKLISNGVYHIDNNKGLLAFGA